MTIQIHTPRDAKPTGEAATAPATGSQAATAEYYILCPQRGDDVPGLITHLISRDVCEKRQAESYHKCPNCVRSAIWRARNGIPAPSAASG